MRTSLTIRVFLGFVALLLVFTATSVYGIYRMDSIRQDLQLTSQGYLELTRALAKVKTIAEAKDAYVERTVAEDNPQVRTYLVRYARDFYPRILRERLSELAQGAHRLAKQDLAGSDAMFAREIAERLDHAIELNHEVESVSATFFERLSDPSASVPAEPLQRHREGSDALGRELKLIDLNLDKKILLGVRRAEEKERDAVWAVVGLSIISLLIGLAISFFVTRALRPLIKLTDAARAISRGAYDVAVPLDRQDEVGALAIAFNEMTQALKDREAVLARRGVEFESLNVFLENVLHSVTTGVVVCDRERELTIVNRAARRLLGLTLVDSVGKALASLPLARLLGDHDQEINAILEDGPALHLESLPLKPPSGPTALVDVRVIPFKQPGAHRNVGGIVFLLDDVSERERTRERLLQNERLAAMGRLAAQVAHEVRNPLSSIGLNCELLVDEVKEAGVHNTEVARLLEAIASEIDRLADVTEGYLRYARIPEASMRPADVCAVITDVADFFRPELERRGLHLKVAVDNPQGEVSIDPSRIRHALLNMIRNAADASPEGGTVTVAVVEAGNHLEIAVEDEGPGVAPEHAESIFKPFYSTKEGGTGLGLSVTRDVALEHGGVAGYSARSPQGSRFYISIARADIA